MLESILRGALGMASLIGISYLFSNNRKAIDWKLVGTGVLLQLIFALGVLHVGFIRNSFELLSNGFVSVKIGRAHV